MRSILALLVALLVVIVAVSAQTSQPAEPLPCYKEKCSKLIDVLKECNINVDPQSGNINFPANANADTDKCLCKQPVINAYDPCFLCGAESQKIQERYSTLKLVDSCNANFGPNTVKMPGESAASNVRASSFALMAITLVASMIVLA